MKHIWKILILLLISFNASAQTGADSSITRDTVPDTVPNNAVIVTDTIAPPLKKKVPKVVKVSDSSARTTVPSVPGTVVAIDSFTAEVPIVKDSVVTVQPEMMTGLSIEAYRKIIHSNPQYNFKAPPMAQVASSRKEAGREGQFYLLCGVVLFFAMIRTIFGKYLQNLFAVFFRISMKQKQLREQLLQMPLPSLLLNLLFVVAGGIYISHLMRYYQVLDNVNEWLLLLYSSGLLSVIYFVKLMVLKLTGWIFNMKEATSTYIFIVFLVNKLLGIFLLPLILFLSFSDSVVVSVTITLSYILILIFFGYRYLISYSAVRKEIKVSPFHFFLYLCAFEIIPLVLIYKVLLEFVYRSP
ncbi:MAG: DUF4271 domain-containing protein [Chitinophagaceae bacterium]|nr:DUF4271 domain-containing protein [Chitinophagaceae bacterium]